MSLPTGPRVTFLFTDIEGSTRLERSLGSATWSAVVAEHDRRMRAAIESAGGIVVKTEGDAFFAAFPDPAGAVEAIAAAERAIAGAGWPIESATDPLAVGADAEAATDVEVELRVRAGLHLGEGRLRERQNDDESMDYVGIDVNYAARIAAAANGGQVILSDALAAALRDDLEGLLASTATSLVDVGLRIVKDFEEPARLYQLVIPDAADDHRPLRTLEAPTNLPHEATSLVGREVEIERLSHALEEGRIVTLTGPGGSGKTRLAIGVAAAVRSRFPHGVWFVDLAAVRDPAMLETTIAEVIGVRESKGQSAGEAVLAHLRERETLLVIDNLEQLLPDAANRVAALIRSCPGLRLLITSRELLRISGERGYPVPPLDVAAGILLFEDRALAQRPDLVLNDETRATIRAICERLGGLPLAIELAAARVRLFAPAAILDRLGRSLDLGGGARDVPERQRTLRGAIDWSHELLSGGEQGLFRRLSVFSGGWTAEDAAEVVDSADGGSTNLDIDLLGGLESLADKSLVRIEPGQGPDDVDAWFSEHPLLREYGQERLEASGERPDREARHAAVYADLAETEASRILGPTGERALRRLDREQHNLRDAVAWSLAHDQPAIGLRIIGSTWRWYQQRGRLREARGLLGQLLAHPETVDIRVRIAALSADGGLAYWMDDFDAADKAYDERLSLAIETGDPLLLADAHYDMGFLSMVRQDLASLREHEQLALDLYMQAGRENDILRARQALVLGVFLSGDYEMALALETQNLEAYRRAGSLFQVADSMTLLAGVAYRLGDPEASWARMQEGLRFWRTNDLASGLARGLGMASIILFKYGDPELAARIAAVTYKLVREKGVMLAPVKVIHLPDPADSAVEVFGAERAAELLADEAAGPLAEMIDTVLSMPTPTADPNASPAPTGVSTTGG
jgi:predicted ATPase/class 3 adenylate cyclase